MKNFRVLISTMKQNKVVMKAGAIILALVLWELCALLIKQDIILVGPIDVIRRFFTIWKEENFFSSIWFSFYHIVLGFSIGTILGIFLGFLAGRFSVIETFLWPYMVCVKSIPVASIVVICFLWLSARNLSVFISFLIVLPIMYQNTLTGYKSQTKELKEMADLFHIQGFKRFYFVILPQMKSYLVAGIATASGMAWKAGVAAEVIGTPDGSIGQQLFLSKIYLDTDDLFAWTVALVLVSVFFEKALVWIMKRLLP